MQIDIKTPSNGTIALSKQVSKDLEKLLKQAGAKQIPQSINKLKVIWLHLSECTGCSESFLRTDLISFDDLIIDIIDLDYHETFMAASGHLADLGLEGSDYALLVEGALSADGYFSTGALAHSSREHLRALASGACVVFAVGSCSCYGGIQAAAPNPTQSHAITDLVGRDAVLIPGCPPSDVNIVATLAYYACYRELPPLVDGKPSFAYGKCLHDMCERKVAFESGRFVYEYGDDGAKAGDCLFYLGCKGPYTYNNCPRVKFNAKTSWPVRAGHGCIACSEKDFWDGFGHYQRPLRGEFFGRFDGISLDGGGASGGAGGGAGAADGGNSEISLDSAGGVNGADCAINSAKSAKSKHLIITDAGIIDASSDRGAIADAVGADSVASGGNSEISLDSAGAPSTADIADTGDSAKYISSFVFDKILPDGKIGGELVANYAKRYFEPSVPPFALDGFAGIWRAAGWFLYAKDCDVGDLLDIACKYDVRVPSEFDYKLALKDDAKIDFSKALRLVMIYRLGGLDDEAILFGLATSVTKCVRAVLCEYDASFERAGMFRHRIFDILFSRHGLL